MRGLTASSAALCLLLSAYPALAARRAAEHETVAGTQGSPAAAPDLRKRGFLNRPYPSLGQLREDSGKTVPEADIEDFVLVPQAKVDRFRLKRDWLLAPYLGGLAALSGLTLAPAATALAEGRVLHASALAAGALAVTAAGYHLGDMQLRVGHFGGDGYFDGDGFAGETAGPFVNHHAAVAEQSAWSPLQVASLYTGRALFFGALTYGAARLSLGALLPKSLGFAVPALTLGTTTAWVVGNLAHREAHRDWEQEDARAKGEPLPYPERHLVTRTALKVARATGFFMSPEWHKKHHGDGTKRFGTASQLADKLADPVLEAVVTRVARATAARPAGPAIHRAFLENRKWLSKHFDLAVAYFQAHPEIASSPAELPGPAGLKISYPVPTRFAQVFGVAPKRLPEVLAFLQGHPEALGNSSDAALRQRLAAVQRPAPPETLSASAQPSGR